MVKELISSTWRLLAMLVAVFIIAVLITAVYILQFYKEPEAGDLAQADCAVVFGAALEPERHMSAVLSGRLLTAFALYKAGKVSCIVVSGADSVFGGNEAEVMRDALLRLKVPGEDIILDTKGDNTCQTVANLSSKRSYILVSNDFHLARIDYFARFFNLNYELYPAVNIGGHYRKEAYFFLREIFANWYYRFFFHGKCDSNTFWISNTSDKYVNKLINFFSNE